MKAPLRCGLDGVAGKALLGSFSLLPPDFLSPPFDDGQLALDRVVRLAQLLEAVLDPADALRRVHARIWKSKIGPSFRQMLPKLKEYGWALKKK